jgi:hypothetical protein
MCQAVQDQGLGFFVGSCDRRQIGLGAYVPDFAIVRQDQSPGLVRYLPEVPSKA